MVERKSGRSGLWASSLVIPPVEVVGLDTEELQKSAAICSAVSGKNTQVNYDRHLFCFEEWCGPRKLGPADVVSKHVLVYLDGARSRPKPVSASWMRGSVAALKKALKWHGYSDRVNWVEVNEWIKQEQIDERRVAASVDGLTWDLIQNVVTAAWIPKDGEWPEKTRRRATADAALLSLMWGCLLRRREAAAATWGDIKVEMVDGHVFGVLTIPFGKTDKLGQGEVGYVHLDTLALLQDMAVACGRDPSRADERIFGIGERQVWNRINAACAHAGLRGRWAGHSPRIGAARDLIKHGTSLVGAMQAGRWRDPRTLWRYVRAMAVGDAAVARLYADLERSGDLSSFRQIAVV